MAESLWQWEINEYHPHTRGVRWYALFVLIFGALAVYAAVTANFLFLFILLMIAGIMILADRRSPRRLTVSIEKDGLRIGGEWHPWKNIEYFWVVNEPEVQSLYLETSETFKPHLCVSLFDQDVAKITKLVGKFVREEVGEEPLSDILSRVLKL